ncbi:MAG TPA: MOSC domain-containing protein [Phycisphaerales bacterium]|nr:MOSC domain-containing protein [Phycisphaerales bacterium]
MANRAGILTQISVSDGGVPKRAVASAVISTEGVLGDRQRDLEHHGGPDRAVCLFSAELIERLREEGHPIEPGSAGENLTITGLDWAGVCPGARLRIGGDVVLEITGYTSPCRTIAGSFAGGDFSRISQKKHPGESRVYAKVVAGGMVRAGDDVRVIEGSTVGGGGGGGF